MQERRKEKRVLVEGPIKVIEQADDQVIGNVIDLSAKGLRITGPVQIEPFEHIRMTLRLPEKILGKTEIFMVAECMWTGPDPDNSENWQSGFEIYEISQKDSSTLIGLLMEIEKAN